MTDITTRAERFPAKSGQPTATKERGAEWYYPAVTCEYGRPRRLPHGNRHETRGKAKAEARQLIREAYPAQQEGAKG